MNVMPEVLERKERKKWRIRMIKDGVDVRSTEFEGSREDAKKFAEEWARKGSWSKRVAEVRVELWDGAEITDGWYQFSYDPSKSDPYYEAGYKYRMEHGSDTRCPACGRVGPKVRTPGLYGMDSYLSWREMEPHAFLAWCQCPACGEMWDCVDEEYVRKVELEMKKEMKKKR